jgi:TIR domain
MATVFFSYSHQDEALRNELEKHLTMLKREGSITAWHDRRIKAGDNFGKAIDGELEKADVVLLLVSSDFLSSDYCYSKEMQVAMDRQEQGEARVIPIILRACDWHRAPFGKLLALPTDGKPITSWPNRDEAFANIATGVRDALAGLPGNHPPSTKKTSAQDSSTSRKPRSSNLRIAKEFTERDRDAFKDAGFEFMATFFEESLQELQTRNDGIETSFKRIDATRFSAMIYRNGKALAQCTIRLGGIFGNGISLSLGQHSENSINENLTVESDDTSVYFKPSGFQMRGTRGGKMEREAAAEYYWSIFIEPLQR